MRNYLLSLMNARTSTHIMHLATSGYAEHVALGSFYEGVVPLIDSLAETYQGAHGRIQWGVANGVIATSNPIKLLQSLREESVKMREELEADEHLQNIVDEITSLIDSTLYKLKFLS